MRPARSLHGSLVTSTQEVHTATLNGLEDTTSLSTDSNQQLECSSLAMIKIITSNCNGQKKELKIHLEQLSKVEEHQRLDRILNSKLLKSTTPNLCQEK